MTLKQLKRKYLAEGFKRGYKRALKENANRLKWVDYLFDGLEEAYSHAYEYSRPRERENVDAMLVASVWKDYYLDDFVKAVPASDDVVFANFKEALKRLMNEYDILGGDEDLYEAAKQMAYAFEGKFERKRNGLHESFEEDDDLDGWYSEPFVAGDIEEGDVIITNYGEKITALVSNVEISSQYKFRGNNVITDIWVRELPYGSVLHFDSSRSDLFRSKDNVTVIKPDDFDSLPPRIRNRIDEVEAMVIPGKY